MFTEQLALDNPLEHKLCRSRLLKRPETSTFRLQTIDMK